MVEYFTLQYTFVKRQMSDLGINPILGFLLSTLAFLLGSLLLFEKTDFAKYIYLLFCFSTISSLGLVDRSDFLKQLYSYPKYYFIRLIENCMLALPFTLFLFHKLDWIFALICVFGGAALVLLDKKSSMSMTIVTPFGAVPFEFAIGFRKSFLMYAAIVILLIIAIKVDNFNLGAFCLLLIYMLGMSYVGSAEPIHFVWIHVHTSKGFLQHKVLTSFRQVTLLALPIILLLLIFFMSDYLYVFGIAILGSMYLTTVQLGKYSAFPFNMSLPHAIFIGLCFVFPPLLLFLIPFFYKKAITQLDNILV